MTYTEESLRQIYLGKFPLFERTGKNVCEALTIFLSENKISTLPISMRIKSFDSFFEKISRKNYSNPFDDTEDFCGVRVIVYYLSDIEKVNEIIKTEFEIQTDENKSDELEVNELGYRSHHFIIKLKESWLATPNYRGLKNIKIEIQVRTVLMHAWAAIEHELGYKNKEQVPNELRRKMFLISGKLEEADQQFQEMNIDIGNYKRGLISKAIKDGVFSIDEFNLNSLQALLDYYFPDHEKHVVITSDIFKQIKDLNIPPKLIVEYAEKIQPFIPFIDKKLFGENSNLKTIQPNIMSYALEALHPSFSRERASTGRLQLISELERLLK